MALKELDLQDQEQLDNVKAFWKQYGNIISTVLIVVFGSIAAYRGWQLWQGKQAEQAAAMFDEVERSLQSGESAKIERAFADMKERFGGTTYASQAGLMTAKSQYEKGEADKAKTTLEWVASSGVDDSYKAIAKLRLSGLLAEGKKYDEALKLIDSSLPKDYEALAADRKGDILLAQDKREEAKAAYLKAHKSMDDREDYRRLIEAKLNTLGVDVSEKKDKEKPAATSTTAPTPAATPATAAPAPATTASEAAKK